MNGTGGPVGEVREKSFGFGKDGLGGGFGAAVLEKQGTVELQGTQLIVVAALHQSYMT